MLLLMHTRLMPFDLPTMLLAAQVIVRNLTALSNPSF